MPVWSKLWHNSSNKLQKKDGFVIMTCNNVWDFEANILKTILNNAETAPKLQKIENEGLKGLIGDDGRCDIRVNTEWR